MQLVAMACFAASDLSIEVEPKRERERVRIPFFSFKGKYGIT